MADPLTLTAVSIGASAGGSLLSAFGAEQQGKSQSQMYAYQAGIANLNKQIALQNEDYAVATGETQAQNYGIKARQRMGAIRAGQGASGIDVSSGSSVDVQKSQQGAADIDLAQIRNNAARKAYGYSVEATQDTAQSQLYTRASADALQAGNIKALASLVSGAGSVSDKWLQASTSGVFNG